MPVKTRRTYAKILIRKAWIRREISQISMKRKGFSLATPNGRISENSKKSKEKGEGISQKDQVVYLSEKHELEKSGWKINDKFWVSQDLEINKCMVWSTLANAQFLSLISRPQNVQREGGGSIQNSLKNFCARQNTKNKFLKFY